MRSPKSFGRRPERITEARAGELRDDLFTAIERAGVPSPPLYCHHLRDEVDGETLATPIAGRGPIAHQLGFVTRARAKECERPLSLLHLPTELHLEVLRTD